MTYAKPQALYEAGKLMQTDLNTWMQCSNEPCREKRRCLGGPRGTCRRTGGWPKCTREGKARLAETAEHRKWLRDQSRETESPSERGTRRLQSRLMDMQMQLVSAGMLEPNPELAKLLQEE